MFDLEQSIAAWRKQMLAAGIKTPVPLEELEIHLREEIEQEMKLGQSGAEAFISAVQNIGSANTVQNEFEKVEEAQGKRRRKEGRIWLGAILGLLQLTVVGAILFNSEMTFGQRMSSLAAIATSILLVVVVRLSHRMLPVIQTWWSRTAIVFILGGVPAIIWFWIFAPSLLPGPDFGQYLVRLLWVNCPLLGVFLGLILGIETAAQKQIATAD